MANSRFNKQVGQHKGEKTTPPPTGHRGPKPGMGELSTANWPGLPGKTQPRNRSGGTNRIKQSMKSEGV